MLVRSLAIPESTAGKGGVQVNHYMVLGRRQLNARKFKKKKE